MEPIPIALTFNQLPQHLRARLVEGTRGRDPAVILTRRNNGPLRLGLAVGLGAFSSLKFFAPPYYFNVFPRGPTGLALAAFGLTWCVLEVGWFLLRRPPYVPSVLVYAGTEVDLSWDGRVWVRPLPQPRLHHSNQKRGGYVGSSISVGQWFLEQFFDRQKADQRFAYILDRIRPLREAAARGDAATCIRLDPFLQWPDRVPPQSLSPVDSLPRVPEQRPFMTLIFLGVAAVIALVVMIEASP